MLNDTEGTEDDDVDFLREIIVDLTKQRAEIQSQLLEEETANRCLQRQVNEMRLELSAKQTTVEVDLHSHYNEELRDLREEHKLMVTQCKDDMRRMRNLEEHNEVLKRDVEYLTRRLESSEREREDACKEALLLRQANNQLTEKLTSILEEVHSLRANVTKMNEEDFQEFYLRKCREASRPNSSRMTQEESERPEMKMDAPVPSATTPTADERDLEGKERKQEQGRTEDVTSHHMKLDAPVPSANTSTAAGRDLEGKERKQEQGRTEDATSQHVRQWLTELTPIPTESTEKFRTHREMRGIDHVLGEKGVPGSAEHMLLVQYIGRATSVWERASKVEELAPKKVEEWRTK